MGLDTVLYAAATRSYHNLRNRSAIGRLNVAKFTVYVFSEGEHTETQTPVVVDTELPKLPVMVEGWDSVKVGCCWEAYDASENCVAFRSCKGPSKPKRRNAPLEI